MERTAGRLVVVVALAALTGCATKADIRQLRTDLTRVEARQDSVYELLLAQNRRILDALGTTTDRLLDVRGELGNELVGLREQVVQMSELMGQVQVRLNQLDQSLTGAVTGGGVGPDAAGPVEGGQGEPTMARDVYEAGLEQLDRGNPATARRAFQMVVDSFPSDPIAADAQRQVGETYALEGDYDEALAAFDRVVQRYQGSEAAPRALYRAGVIAQERGQLERARAYFQRVISGYPNSDARRLAEAALDRIG